MSDMTKKTGPLGRLPTPKKLKVQACLYFKPGSHKIDVSRLKIGPDANICVHLKGNRDGFVLANPSTIMTMMGIEISAPRGLLDLFTGHKVHRRWSSIKVIDGVPYLNEWHTDTKGAVYSWDHRSTNIFKKYGKRIPTSYDPKNNRRYTQEEYTEVLDDFSAGEWMLPRSRFHRVQYIPILGNAVNGGRLPKHIPYSEVRSLARVLSTTHSWLEPETREEKIVDRIFQTLGSSIASTSTELEVVLDKFERPGLIAVFGASTMIRAKLSTADGINPPYNLNVNADVDLKRLSLAGLIDVRNASATIKSKVSIPPGELASLDLHVTRIEAPISHNGITAMITEGKGAPGAPIPGIRIFTEGTRSLMNTANLHVRYRIPTPQGALIINGDVHARLKGRWNGLTAMPRFAQGNNTVTVKNLTIHREGSNLPLIANASLIISDNALEKSRIKSTHPEIPMINSGFAAQLTVPIFNGRGLSSGSAATYIHVPLNRRNTHYDLGRFSLQNVLEVAFRFTTEDRGKIAGNISAERQQNGWKIIAHANADKIKVGGATITNPTISALVHLQGPKWINIRQLLATTDHISYRDVSVRNIRVNLKRGALMLGQEQATVHLDKYEVVADGLDTGKMWISRAAIGSRSPSEIFFTKNGAHLKRSSSYFSLLHLRPHGSRRVFNFRGHVSGRWKGEHGLLNIRLGRPTLSGAHLVITRISSFKKGSRLTAAFCLRKPTNLASLRPLGIHSKGVIWFITGSDHMPLTATAILGQLGIHDRSSQSGITTFRSTGVRQRCERIFGIRQ